MSEFIKGFTALIVETIEVPGDSKLEAVAKRLFPQFVGAIGAARKLQDLADAGDAEILGVAQSLTKLALQFNRAFKLLTTEQKDEISAVVKGIVTGANQSEIEAYFDLTLEIVGTAQEFGQELTVLLESVPDGDEA